MVDKHKGLISEGTGLSRPRPHPKTRSGSRPTSDSNTTPGRYQYPYVYSYLHPFTYTPPRPSLILTLTLTENLKSQLLQANNRTLGAHLRAFSSSSLCPLTPSPGLAGWARKGVVVGGGGSGSDGGRGESGQG